MARVTFVGTTCIYPGSSVPAVDRLDLDVADGEFMVLVGPSGSGKSTALRMVAGLEPVTEGEVHIGGKDVSETPPKQRDIAMVFQNYALYPHMSVADNMGFALKLRGLDKATRTQRVREAAQLLDLEPYLERKPRELSGGQRQRVAMGRAIVREPSAFLMDEPLSNLDAKLRVETRSNIAELQGRLGVTTIYVTHDQVEAMTMGHRVAVLKDGVLQQVDRPRVLYDQPVNAFVAAFIGSPAMNLRAADLVSGGARLGDATIPLSTEVTAAAAQAALTRVTIGMRPESVSVAAGTGADAGFRFEVSLVEELGADAYLYGRLPDDDAKDKLFTLRFEGHAPPSIGETISLEVRPDAVHVFHPITGDRLGSMPACSATLDSG
jgi:multiple sugar transport system ATP-binding protein